MSTRIVVLSVLIAVALAADTPLTCTFDNGGDHYDLSSLSNPNADYVIQYDPLNTQRKVWMNLCRSAFQTLCGTGSSACQQWDPNNKNGQASLGAESTIVWSIGTQQSGQKGLVASFTGGTLANGVPRSMQIDFTCAEGAGAGNPAYNLEVNLKYYFTWTTAAACPVNGGGSGGSGGLSGGSIFLIIFFVGFFVYFAAGVGFKAGVRKARGVEMVPNFEFWTSLPGLVKDGALFVVRKITRRGGESYTPVK